MSSPLLLPIWYGEVVRGGLLAPSSPSQDRDGPACPRRTCVPFPRLQFGKKTPCRSLPFYTPPGRLWPSFLDLPNRSRPQDIRIQALATNPVQDLRLIRVLHYTHHATHAPG